MGKVITFLCGHHEKYDDKYDSRENSGLLCGACHHDATSDANKYIDDDIEYFSAKYCDDKLRVLSGGTKFSTIQAYQSRRLYINMVDASLGIISNSEINDCIKINARECALKCMECTASEFWLKIQGCICPESWADALLIAAGLGRPHFHRSCHPNVWVAHLNAIETWVGRFRYTPPRSQ